MAEFTKVFTNNSQFKLILTYTHSQNITNNTTTVNATLKVQSMAYGVASGWVNKSAGISINGNNVTYTFNPNMGANSTKTIATRSYTFNHNADGTKSVNISANANYTGVTWNGGALGNVTLGGTVGLPTIPRASSIASISGGTLGSALTVNITRASSSFTHKVGYYRTDGSRTMDIIGNVATSTSFTLPLSDASLLPSATTGTAKIIVDTYSGSTRIGSTSKTFKVTVPDSVVPSVTFFNLTENITATKNIGLAANTFVKNKSQIAMTAGASGSYGSSIKDYTFSFNGASQGGTVGRQFNVGNITGNHTAKVVVKDSRGRTAERTVTAVILDYNPPKINGFGVWRDGSGVVKANVNCSISILGGKGGAWYVDSGAGTSWTNRNSGSLTSTSPSHNSNITIVGTYPDTASAGFRLRLNDAFGAGPIANANVSTSKTALSLYKDIGIGVGKRWEKGALDVGGKSYLNGEVVTTGDFSSKGYTTLTAGSTNSGGNDVPLHLNRANATPVAVFASNGTAGDFAMNLYNQNGAWTRAHLFKHNGKTEFSGDLTVQYWMYAQKFVQDGQPIHTDRPNGVLWTGGLWMNSDQTVVLPKTIDQAPNGWIIVMKALNSDKDYSYTVLHKSHPTGVGFGVPFYWNWGDNMAGRYMYLESRNTLRGSRTYEINSPKGGGFVMSKVIEF